MKLIFKRLIRLNNFRAVDDDDTSGSLADELNEGEPARLQSNHKVISTGPRTQRVRIPKCSSVAPAFSLTTHATG